ncbi:GNAT family N-acetyltransferase [Pseudooceanicola sediminis]|uniref:GNAT family N-acetyltransferase n=1 Tax=Pseudooceanicola sediminis TaxID=2211117 RepID=A0A399IYZ1_9RHOB|nr:GNAT family N-acetyltransferase [Pseudooceanicola sediminis]KAA2313449.1 GNAT family N-acetyltransferase [Puniceibacterium sp. HSS470]RII38275.1 GNAT family N-acetyltransferase [Pseudooceanicola sediminis]|tara:strand:+ start:36419 stop:36853 length:435 start_codon:yes stop_codon:yes gene_type:complete
MTWRFEEVSDPAPCFALRRTVFIQEQGFAEADEWDALDADAVHLLASDATGPLGTARLLCEGAAFAGNTGRIGRICVAKPARGTGLGAAIVRDAVERLRARGCTRVILGAQVRAAGFYEKLGFRPCGQVYDDGGVPHQEMDLAL